MTDHPAQSAAGVPAAGQDAEPGPALIGHPDAALAAGLLFDVDLDAASVPDLLERLRQRSSASMLWTRLGGGSVPLPPARERWDAHLPLWRKVPMPPPAVAERLAAAWQLLVAEQPAPVDAVRVEVAAPDDAQFLAHLAGVTGGPVSAVIGLGGLRFRWSWPLRIGVAGPHARAWAARINSHPHSPQHFSASVADPDAPLDDVAIAIVDADVFDPDDQTAWEQVMATTWSASVVVVVGGAPAVELLNRVDTGSHTTAAIPEAGVEWWPGVYEDLAHDRPLDLALRRQRPGALVCGVGRVLDATAVGHWALEVARREPRLAELQRLIGQVWFDSESQGARMVIRWVGQHAPGVTVEDSQGETAAISPDVETPPDQRRRQPPSPGRRRLIAAIWDGERECRTVARPDRDLTLELRIAVPTADDIAAGEEFPALPTQQVVAELEVEVTSDVWLAPQTQRVQLATESSDPSTSAMFGFHSPPAGSTTRFDVVVRFQGRTLQTAVLTVPVRERAAGRDRIRFLATVTTAGPEPSPASTSAEYALSARSGTLTRGPASVPLGDVQTLLDILERRASLTLGVDPAPQELTDPKARELLVFLARRGSQLHDKLAPLQIGPEGSISLLVRADTPVLPIELVYQGEPPRQKAKLCRHVTEPEVVAPPEWGHPCALAGRNVVCPYAFWGMYRTVIRDVELPPGVANPRVLLTLAPVLYAATVIADVGTAPGTTKPSDQLAQEAEDLFGKTAVSRVTNWTAWRRGVRSHPRLLLLLAHRESFDGETGLFIGQKSFLASVDVRNDVVSTAGGQVAPPLVLLMACASASAGNEFGTLPGAFAARGAAAVVGTLSKLSGPQGSRAGRAILRSLRQSAVGGGAAGVTLAESLARARRDLVAEGLLIGLLLVSHGDVDLRIGG